MKYAILADTHFGISNDSNIFHDSNQKFFDKVFFPTLREKGINNIIHLGDVFHNRFKIDVHTIRRAREYFFEPLADYSTIIIAGNHDIYWRDVSDTNAIRELCKQYPYIQYTTECVSIKQLLNVNDDMLLIPWINQSNHERTINVINASGAKYAFGHLELVGFYQNKSHISTKGYDANIFNKFKHVFSGHYHMKNSSQNITYVGSVQQHNWGDLNDNRGFHIFDSETGQIEFVDNPYGKMFKMITINQATINQDVDNCINQHVRVVIDLINPDQSKIDRFVSSIEAFKPISVKIMVPSNSFIKQQLDAQTTFEIEDDEQMFKLMIVDDVIRAAFIEIYHQAIQQ